MQVLYVSHCVVQNVYFGHFFHWGSGGDILSEHFKPSVNCLDSVSLSFISFDCFQILCWFYLVPMYWVHHCLLFRSHPVTMSVCLLYWTAEVKLLVFCQPVLYIELLVRSGWPARQIRNGQK